MKKLLSIIAVCSLFSVASFAQFNVYHPFPDSNAIWGEDSMDCSCGYGCGDERYAFVLKGDTVVNGLTYHKVYQNGGYISWCGFNGAGWFYSYKFFGAYREDTMKHIYACCTSYLGSHDSLLYDFNLKVGDTLKQYTIHNGESGLYYSPFPYTIHSIDSTLVAGQYRKRFNIEIGGSTGGLIPSIIEGVGGTQGLFDLIYAPFEVFSRLDCFSQNGKTIWPYPATDSCGLYYLGTPAIKQPPVSISVYPNPSNGIFTIAFSHPELVSGYQTIIKIYNAMGQEIYSATLKQVQGDNLISLSSQPNGIYFYRIVEQNSNLIGEGKLIIQK